MPRTDPFLLAERRIQGWLAQLPPPVSRFLGYCDKKLFLASTWVHCVWGFVGAFGGLSLLFAVFGHSNYFTKKHVPALVASYGASAILCYGAIEVPLAQPRALVFGHFFSALVGIFVAAIFRFDLDADDDAAPKLQWLAASLAAAIALVVMHATKTTHPPAGATALLPCIDPQIWRLKWYFLPVVLLSSILVLASALLVNNIQRQYPKFWIMNIPPPKDSQIDQSQQGESPSANLECQQPLAYISSVSPNLHAEGQRAE